MSTKAHLSEEFCRAYVADLIEAAEENLDYWTQQLRYLRGEVDHPPRRDSLFRALTTEESTKQMAYFDRIGRL